MNRTDKPQDPAQTIRDAADDATERFENLAVRLSDAVAFAGERLRHAEDAVIDLARDLEPHATRVVRATENFAYEAKKSLERAARKDRPWYWPFAK